MHQTFRKSRTPGATWQDGQDTSSAIKVIGNDCRRIEACVTVTYTVSQHPPKVVWQFFQNGWEFFDQILRGYYVFLFTLDYEFLFNYLQLWRSYAILSVTTLFTSCAQNVHHRAKRTLAFSDIFPKRLGILSPNFARTLHRTRSNLRWTTNFYSIICNFDEVMPY